MSNGKSKGVVKWFSARKGYGFIAPSDGDKDIFVHYKGLLMEGYKELQVDDAVAYNLKDSPKGPIAIDVEILQSSQETEKKQ